MVTARRREQLKKSNQKWGIKRRAQRLLDKEQGSFRCETCNHTFVDKDNLQRHLKSRKHDLEERKVRMDGRPHACSFCDKTFKDTWSRNIHERTHTGEIVYWCP
ncbi:hypothetical protein KAR91_04305, partial [Candidatus Pacearchaeota archaeon]|nr:hypothetical protein [Candidatus Pacearchaeota archaeon]